MAGSPDEVSPVEGTNEADVLFVTLAQYQSGYSADVIAYGGDDVIVRDRTGGYSQAGGVVDAASIDGGAGFDIVSYASSGLAVTANLTEGNARSHPTQTSSFGYDNYLGVEGLIGSTAGDILVGSGTANRLYGHDGADAIWGQGGNDLVYGGLGNDTVSGGAGADSLHGDGGNDVISGGTGNDVAYGGAGNDTLSGEDNNDVLRGDGGNDVISGGSGADVISGGDGTDSLNGGSGDDIVEVYGTGGDVVRGGSGVDEVVYEQAAIVNLVSGSVSRGGVFDDIAEVENVRTGDAADVVFGTAGANVIRTKGGADVVYTVGGDDTVVLGAGADTVFGASGDERIWGESGNDRVVGGTGADTVHGGSGDDRIQGGGGVDELWGATGADTFEWRDGDVTSNAMDTVEDFELGVDMLAFGPGFFEAQEIPGFDVTDVLQCVSAGGGATNLLAWVDDIGWKYLARFEGVSAAAMWQRIDNGTIFDTEVSAVGDGAQDGLVI